MFQSKFLMCDQAYRNCRFPTTIRIQPRHSCLQNAVMKKERDGYTLLLYISLLMFCIYNVFGEIEYVLFNLNAEIAIPPQ